MDIRKHFSSRKTQLDGLAQQATTKKNLQKTPVKAPAKTSLKQIQQAPSSSVKSHPHVPVKSIPHFPVKSVPRSSFKSPPRSPVKPPQQSPLKLPPHSPVKFIHSPRKVVCFSPSKGRVSASIPTAASVHSHALSKEFSEDVQSGDTELSGNVPGVKRKAEFDRDELKRRIEKTKQLSVKARQNSTTLFQALETGRQNLVPAHLRFASLVEKKQTPPLPALFKALLRLFENMDMSISLIHRHQTTYFDKLKESMRSTTMEILGRLLEYDDLGRVHIVFPEAYIFRVEKPGGVGLEYVSPDKEQMAIFIRDDSKKEVEVVLGSDGFLPQDRTRRCTTFETALRSIVFREHAAFLASRDPPVVVPESKITNWHPAFRVDQLSLPEPAKLPEFSRPKVARTAAEIIAMTPKAFVPKNASALFGPSKPSPVAGPVHPQLKKIDPEFLARVRANQAKRAANVITRDPEIDKRMKIVERLPAMARIILNDFWANQKSTLPLATVIKTLRSSMTAKLSADEFNEHMDVLTELFAEKWLRQISIKSGLFLNIHDGSIGLAEINAIIQKEMDRLRAL